MFGEGVKYFEPRASSVSMLECGFQCCPQRWSALVNLRKATRPAANRHGFEPLPPAPGRLDAQFLALQIRRRRGSACWWKMTETVVPVRQPDDTSSTPASFRDAGPTALWVCDAARCFRRKDVGQVENLELLHAQILRDGAVHLHTLSCNCPALPVPVTALRTSTFTLPSVSASARFKELRKLIPSGVDTTTWLNFDTGG